MKFINFGVKRSCFWYVTDFIERMLEVWNKYIDSMCAITFNTMNLLDHTCCTFIVFFIKWTYFLGNTHILLRFVSDCYMYFSLGSIHPTDLSQLSFVFIKWTYFLGNTYILLSFVSDCYMYFSLGSIQPPNLSQLSFFIKWT